MSGNGEGEAVELVIAEGEEVQGDEEADKVRRKRPNVSWKTE